MERTPLFILDASVAVKWFVNEPERDRAVRVREDYVHGRINLRAPALMLYEVGNALRFHHKGTEEIGARVVKSLRRMQLTPDTLQDKTIETAMTISYVEGITFYDAVYLALAENNRCKVITADQQLVRVLKKYGSLALLLRDYAL